MDVREKKLREKLKDFYCDIHFDSGTLSVTLYDGDWKHDHLYLDIIMKKLGYVKIIEYEIGHSDEDFYSACHIYKY